MTDFIWCWVLPDGTLHFTTNYHEANEALHSPSHPRVYGTKVHYPPSSDVEDIDMVI